jgi:hypothetical protein
MIPDQLLRLADGQSLTVATGNTPTTNVVDIDTLRNLGVGTPLYVRIKFDTVYAQASGGVNVYVAYADDPALSTGSVELTRISLSSTAIPAAGTVLYLSIPPVAKVATATSVPQSMVIPNNSKKYLGVVWQPFTANVTGTGTWTVDIVTEVNMVEHTYAKGFTVQ